MKNTLLILISFFLFINNINSQSKDLKVELVQPYQDTISDSIIQYQIKLTNVGTSSIVSSDSIYLYIEINNIKYNPSGSLYSPYKVSFPFNLGIGGTTTSPIYTFPNDSIRNLVALNEFCLSFEFIDTIDVDTTNNTDCFYINYLFTSLSEHTIENSISINQYKDRIELINKGDENLNYRVLSLDGKIIESGILNHSKEIDLFQQNAGLYIINLYNSTGSYSKKIVKS